MRIEYALPGYMLNTETDIIPVVRHEYRHYDTTNSPHAWTEWTLVEPRNIHLDPYGALRLGEIRAYIEAGYKYQIRALTVYTVEGWSVPIVEPEIGQ